MWLGSPPANDRQTERARQFQFISSPHAPPQVIRSREGRSVRACVRVRLVSLARSLARSFAVPFLICLYTPPISFLPFCCALLFFYILLLPCTRVIILPFASIHPFVPSTSGQQGPSDHLRPLYNILRTTSPCSDVHIRPQSTVAAAVVASRDIATSESSQRRPTLAGFSFEASDWSVRQRISERGR